METLSEENGATNKKAKQSSTNHQKDDINDWPVEYLEESFIDNDQIPNGYQSDDSGAWPVEFLNDTSMEIDESSDVRSIEFVEQISNDIND